MKTKFKITKKTKYIIDVEYSPSEMHGYVVDRFECTYEQLKEFKPEVFVEKKLYYWECGYDGRYEALSSNYFKDSEVAKQNMRDMQKTVRKLLKEINAGAKR